MRRGISFAALALVVAFAGHAEEQIAYLAATDPYWQVFVVPAEGGEARQVTRSPYEKARISWYPDGRYLLVNALDGRAFRVDSRSGSEEEIPMPFRGTTDAVVSPEGRRIAFSLSMAGSIDDNEIWVVDIGSDDATRLTLMPYLQEDPHWSPDGRWIYFLSGDGKQDRDIYRVSVETRATEQVSVAARYHFDLSLANGERLAFSNNRSGDYEIYSQVPGGAPTRLTTSPGLDAGPTWSPDATELAFYSLRGGRSNIWRMRADGGELVQLTHHAKGARDPVWAPRAAGNGP